MKSVFIIINMTLKKQKCFVCNKKLGLLPNKCKCDNFYCNLHSHKHNCTYDHHNIYKLRLENKLFKIVSPKISDI